MSLKFFSIFLAVAMVLAVPAVYQVPCPECHGTGVIQIQVSGMQSIKLLNYTTVLANVVRLGCGTYAVYTTNLTLAFSNAARVPINATVLYSTAYNATGQLTSQYPLTFLVPANATNYAVSSMQPSQVSIQNAPVLPVMLFTAQLIKASNATITMPCPKCHGKGKIPLIELLFPPAGQS